MGRAERSWSVVVTLKVSNVTVDRLPQGDWFRTLLMSEEVQCDQSFSIQGGWLFDLASTAAIENVVMRIKGNNNAGQPARTRQVGSGWAERDKDDSGILESIPRTGDRREITSSS